MEVIAVSKKKKKEPERLICPLCENKTLIRTEGPDGWYVETCVGGKIKVIDEEDGTEHVFDCPYWDAGFKKKGGRDEEAQVHN